MPDASKGCGAFGNDRAQMKYRLDSRNWSSPGGFFVACVCLCLVAPQAFAQNAITRDDVLSDPTFTPYPLVVPQDDGGLAFDLAGSEQRSLQLRLADGFSLGTGVRLMNGQADFQSLGSIHCVNGTLSAVSYEASDCYFVDGRNASLASEVGLGARYELTDQASAGVRLFRNESDFDHVYRAGPGLPGSTPVIDPRTLGISPGNPLFSELGAASGLASLDSELTGIDLEFQVGVSMDRAGDVVLGLQLTRVLDGNFETAYQSNPGIRNWTIAQPFDSGSLSIDWYKGPFSGGIQTYYREQVDFLGRPSLEAQGSFDVHFTWRAPWNASLSVGARNVLNAGAEEGNNQDAVPLDPFEAIYGRIPYVRYKQDL